MTELKRTKKILTERRQSIIDFIKTSNSQMHSQLAGASLDMLNDIEKAIEEDLIEDQRRPDLEKDHESIEGAPC